MTTHTLKPERFIWHNLLNCFLRELKPQTELQGHHLLVPFECTQKTLKVGLTSRDPLHFSDEVWLQDGKFWVPTHWEQLGEVLEEELSLRTGTPNPEFKPLLQESARFTLRFLEARTTPPEDGYLHSEQSLMLGHRFHPTPKSRSGNFASWERYSPELKTRFALCYFAVREDFFDSNREDLCRFEHEALQAPEGYRLLPAHPWQAKLAVAQPAITKALQDGILLDLGEGEILYSPTSSIRTLYREGHPWFYKFSLHARITNCLRKNADYELTSATLLTEHFEGIEREFLGLFPSARVLKEPAYCTVKLDTHSREYLGMLLRENPLLQQKAGEETVLCAALCDETHEHPRNLAHLRNDLLLEWWEKYVQEVVPPVLYLLFQQGMVLEPHLQNVLIVLKDGMPSGVVFRDLEGTKLLPGHLSAKLQEAPEQVRNAVTYSREQGFKRVAYCLLVNHLLEVGRAILLKAPFLKKQVWNALREILIQHQGQFGSEPELQALLDGADWPAKTNLLNRWQRQRDREAGYVGVPNPLRDL